MTNRQLISETWNDLRAISVDDYLPPQFVISKAIDIAADYIKKENDSRRVYKLQEGWKVINCLNLIDVPITSCEALDTYVCKRLQRTKYRLPSTFSTRYGNLIKYVSSVNLETYYEPIFPKQWRAIQNRQYVDFRKKYYFFIDGYIYIPNSDVETITIEAYFKKPWLVDSLIQDECESCDVPDCIDSPLDYEFVCPEYLLHNVKQQLITELASVYGKFVKDSNPDLDSNIKTKQPIQPKE
jgi:hypothetical protein